MRFRTDDMSAAEAHALHLKLGPQPRCECGHPECSWHPETFLKVPPAAPGDMWRTTWYGSGALAGYWWCCPGCGEMHCATSASNCSSRRSLPSGGSECNHTGRASCWDWSGSAEENRLTCRPSLLAHPCGWHGFLTDGQFVPC